MVKYVQYNALLLFTCLGLVACGIQEQGKLPGELGADFHYQQLQDLAGSPRVNVTLVNAFDEEVEGTAGVSESGDIIFEGDIILGQTSELQPQGHLASTSAVKLWYRGVVPYYISVQFSKSQRDSILRAMRHVEDKTNLDFVARTENYQTSYLSFVPSSWRCSSYVGKKGGVQTVNLAPACGKESLVHLLGHAVGLLHEHSRSDRDSYIRLNCSSLAINCDDAAWKKTSGINYGAYDYRSVMHYGAFAWITVSGQPRREQIIFPKTSVPTEGIGNTYLSSGDIAALKRLYPYPASSY
jgi:hypothetical protein